MSALYPPCTPGGACSDTPAYVSFYGGSDISWTALTEPGPSACLVSFVCLRGGIPYTVWTGPEITFTHTPVPPVITPPVVTPPPPIEQPPTPEPCQTPEPAVSWVASIGAGLCTVLRRKVI